MIKVKKGIENHIRQGDVIKDIEYIENFSEKEGNIEISKIQFPLVVVLSQDCDLTWDYKYRYGKPKKNNQDKWLFSILVAPIYNVDHFIEGNHLENLKIKMTPFPKYKKGQEYTSQYNSLTKNEIPRFHYIEFPEDIPIVKSIIDFKHFFTVNSIYLRDIKKTNYICRISELYREDITLRFANYLSRIGLPE